MNSNSSNNDQISGNPVEKFEESFQNCLTAVTKEDTLTNVDKDEIKVDVEQCMQNFIEQARLMEGYFLKKRLHLAAQKPELLIKDDVSELRIEVMRKEELVKKNFEKISLWQTILADLHSTANTTVGGKSGLPPLSGSGSSGSTAIPSSQAGPTSMGRHPTPGSIGRPLTPGSASGRMQSPSGLGFSSPISQPSGLQGPLAFLEKTASGIGMNENRP